MSWLIDELNNKNIRLNQQKNDMQLEVNNLISEYSDLITENHRLEKELENKQLLIDRLTYQQDMSQAIIEDMARDIKRLYPRLRDRIKLLIGGAK